SGAPGWTVAFNTAANMVAPWHVRKAPCRGYRQMPGPPAPCRLEAGAPAAAGVRRLAAKARASPGLPCIVASPRFGVGSASVAADPTSGGGAASAERRDARTIPLGKSFSEQRLRVARRNARPGRYAGT